MKTIALNALNANSGGGKSIRDSFLRLLDRQELRARYVAIVAKGADLGFITNRNIEVVEMPSLYGRHMMVPFVYRFVLGSVLERMGADVVLNIGDLVIHGATPQIYVFDWPYALDVHPKVWADMKPLDWLNRKVKLWLLRRDFHRPEIVISQTGFIKDRLEELYGLKDVRVINNAVTVTTTSQDEVLKYSLPEGIRLVYPAVYYPHKNLEILLDLASLIKSAGLRYRIVTTINPDTGAARHFVDAITGRNLQGVIKNIGQVPLDQMHNLYEQCDALLMPTLLESFSIVYLEAMHHGLPVFTSDMWFAHSVCGEAAAYFDPLDAANILRAIEDVMPDPQAKWALVAAGNRQLASFPSWEENFANYRKVIGELLERD